MAISGHAYLNGIQNLNNATINWSDNSTTTIKVALLANTYTPNQGTHAFFSDVSANEITGTGYTAGGASTGSRAIGLDTGNKFIELTGANVSWTTATFTARYAVVYKSTGTAATSPLVGYIDFGADMAVSGGTFTITWDATGIVRYTAS